jgi:hypothetical protein
MSARISFTEAQVGEELLSDPAFPLRSGRACSGSEPFRRRCPRPNPSPTC